MRIERQVEAAECGLACLSMVSLEHGGRYDLPSLRQLYPASSRGMTVKQIADVASAIGLTARVVTCDIEELNSLNLPAILHWDTRHFVILTKCGSRRYSVSDPAGGARKFSREEISRRFTGVAVELRPAPNFKRQKPPAALKFINLINWSPEITAGLTQVILLSVLLQAFMLISPLYMQIAIDEGAVKGDKSLLAALAVGFGLFTIFNGVAETLRGVATQRVASLLGWDTTTRLFRHSLRLPLPWFQRRRLADTLSRFESIEPIRTFVSNGLITSVVDGVLAVTTAVLMTIYSPLLACIAFVFAVLICLARLATAPLTMKFGADLISAQVAEQGKRIETIRAIQTIKAQGAEGSREGDWANRYAKVVKAEQRNQHVAVGIRAFETAADGVGLIVIVYAGVGLILSGDMTVGVLFAFVAYRSQFQRAMRAVAEVIVNWGLMGLHTSRIADIALTPIENRLEEAGEPIEFRGEIVLENVSFRYSQADALILSEINIAIQAGQSVAIIGPSGSGKSTLLKIIAGLYQPTGGRVMIDGLALPSWGLGNVRRAFGTVLQDDELLAGTIADNVSFFAENIDMDRVGQCLKLACIDEEVRAMPLQTQTFVGDMGSGLSGGQKQRLLIARALYRQSQMLLLDESTSHLDIVKEREINANLKRQRVTRVVVAHRPDTIASADRVIAISNGRVVLDETRKSPDELTTAER